MSEEWTTETKNWIEENTWYWADGNCICLICKKSYTNHERLEVPTFRKLCNGDVVKL